jgi:uncharacterized protein YbbC (DUF1343 family)
LIAAISFSCGNGHSASKNEVQTPEKPDPVTIGANRTAAYLPLLKGKKVAIVGNQTSVIFKNDPENEKNHVHLVDSLLSLGVNVTKVFSPEHGFRGKASAGEIVKDGIDVKTGLPIVSLYGNNKKPTAEQLENVDIVLFDIQDVGLRFYTYISTLHYVMEACAEQNIPILVLDRPNPNGHYVDGPVLEMEYQSFVGMHPVPVVHGLTIGEYAKMINGEKWLKNEVQADLKVIKMENYNREKAYSLPIKPSPNLPNDKAINLYPSLCFFEGTNVSAGRGTDKQFQIFGSPFLDKEVYDFTFTPQSNAGSKNPKHKGKTCYGKNLQDVPRLSKINLEWLIVAYQNTENQEGFFTSYFTKLAGTERLQQQIENGKSVEGIRESWRNGLEEYMEMREEYLLY